MDSHGTSYGECEERDSKVDCCRLSSHMGGDRLSDYEDYLKLKSRVEILQHSQRHLLGEEIAGMGVDELEQLQHQVDTSLRQIRSTKLEERDGAHNQSILGASSSVERSQQSNIINNSNNRARVLIK
ncbi:agamous-like MADS-box protein AGL3 [Raphanus sativus]|uniref:Agamous-like MADS-box protein AGL3 n=1 Tax=Raphanus sativus TaxID=3726 RepID=A0A9W3BVL2_RAPSA|nr:agamous-like MADS-box protein AGL3 [Raphanus sativus]